jgi:hypothetical protein
VAPVHGSPQCLLARHRAPGPGEERKAIRQCFLDLARGEHAHAGRGKLDREWDPVQPTANLGDRPAVCVADAKSGAALLRPLAEQPHGFDTVDSRRVLVDADLGNRKGGDTESDLPLDTERLTARGQD